MKHLLSLVAALAATAALLLGLPPMAQADISAVTTIPDPSGAMSCYGKNPDGGAASWTIGGEIRFTSDVSNPSTDYRNGWHNIKQINDPAANRGGCEYQMTTSSNIQPGCAEISGFMDIYYTPNPGATTSESVGSYSISTPMANQLYTKQTPLPFGELDNVNNVQYKVTSVQNYIELGKAATSYL